ncbi:MAG: FG-GAP-like repeat-containing protein [Acidobacteriia bacterium]|nr:FG-GAP-like repeat-containing protein [Terriglobia bacterium]
MALAAGLLPALGAQESRPMRRPSAAATAKKSAALPPAAIQTNRNLGKAYYEQAKYAEALAAFQKVVASGHALAADYLNLGLALMQANQLDEALGALTTARQMDAGLLAAEYNLGILYKRELRYPDAQAAFKRVVAADPADPAALFNLGNVLFAQRKLEEALEEYQRVIEMGFGRGQNFYVASLFRTFTTLTQLKRPGEARGFLDLHQKMHGKVPDVSLQNAALEGGKYGMIIIPLAPLPAMRPRAGAEKITFSEITARLGLSSFSAGAAPAVEAPLTIQKTAYSTDFARSSLVPLFGPSVAVGDYDGDGLPDLYVVNPAGTNHLFHNNGDGTFTDVTEKSGVAGPGASLSAAFADYDNSGKSSLFVAGLGGVRLYRNNGDGTFTDQTQKAGLPAAPGELDTSAVLFDADNDGFLDLLVTAYTDLNSPPQKEAFLFPDDFAGAAVRFYRNNGDGTFTEMTRAAGLASASGRVRKALFADFNNDGFQDLLFVRDDGPPLLYTGQGEGKFADRTPQAGKDLAQSVALDAQVADFDHDGNFDLVLWTPAGYRVLMNRGDARFVAVSALPPLAAPAGPFAFRGTTADLNGDSFEDLLAADAQGNCRFLVNRVRHFEAVPCPLSASADGRFAGLAPAWLGKSGSLDLVGMTRLGHLRVFEKDGPPGRWLEVKLSGSKSTTQGVGAALEFKAGNFYSKVQATGGTVRMYLGDLARIDVLRVTWPNLIVQNMTNVATNQRVEVRESERLASSCPLLYIWDGKSFVYLTDVLGIAPLGEMSADGSGVPPNTEEYVRLPDSLPEQDGSFVFQISDEMREVEYFDRVQMLAVDHPAGAAIYANEIYSATAVAPALSALGEKRFPLSAVDDRGQDVLPLLREHDRRYPAAFRPARLLGLAELHTLTLDLGSLPDSAPVALWLTGWVFWADSNGIRAASSSSELRMISPFLQVRDAQGRWVTVIPDIGIPSATDRTMRVDLTGKFLSPDHHVRIVTNLCVYWDQIFFTLGDSAAPASAELPLLSADLHYRGFSTPTSDPSHRQPDSFDYDHVLAEAPWNPPLGPYTRYGPVEALLRKPDDQLVVMAPGDELTVRFDATRLPPLRSGYRRTFFLRLSGWAKDGEPNTAFFRTAEPLPSRRMSQYGLASNKARRRDREHQRYLRLFQTRPAYALIPPLTPFAAH